MNQLDLYLPPDISALVQEYAEFFFQIDLKQSLETAKNALTRTDFSEPAEDDCHSKVYVSLPDVISKTDFVPMEGDINDLLEHKGGERIYKVTTPLPSSTGSPCPIFFTEIPRVAIPTCSLPKGYIINRENTIGYHKLYAIQFPCDPLEEFPTDPLEIFKAIERDDCVTDDFDLVSIDIYEDEEIPRIAIYGYYYNICECDYSAWWYYYDKKYKLWVSCDHEDPKTFEDMLGALKKGEIEFVNILCFSRYGMTRAVTKSS